ncbi:nitroreductase family protein [Pseudogemmobacter humi]|uniref:Nitroreductase family protein n=1 Tax=Pseudogemmobacter humi TaxID=2483812 RepID=A0A3P5XN46_9RHOB|nr:nitroreductase family protein [Pseudogemmobacter humi]VDC30128.1 Nitroreductase family protein [Pseudogemmobacter humi]
MSNVIEHLRTRRTQYALGRNVALPKDEIEALIKEAIRLAPSSFNSQSSRAVILFGAESEKVWSLIGAELRKIVPADQFAPTEAKMKSFAAGIGTVLFYEDQATIKGLQENFPLYADAFPGFSMHSAGMAQLAVWTALAEKGIGASLQHYSPIADAALADAFDIPASWKLQAQMPFGSNEAGFQDKTFMADEERFITRGK